MRLRWLTLVTLLLLPAVAGAQDKPAPVEDEDIQFEEAIQEFGFLSGEAYQCLPEAERGAHEREVLASYSGIARLFGTDRAFLYAAAFGAGTSAEVDKAKCPSLLESYRAAMKAGVRAK